MSELASLAVGEVPVVPSLTINRLAYSLSHFNQQFRRISQLSATASPANVDLSPPPESCFKRVSRQLANHWSRYSLRPPIIDWISDYKKSSLIPDLVSGLTIAVFHVPECMGYSFLAKVNPIYCLYTAVFPTLIYAILGTSAHCSIGLFCSLC